MSTVPRVPVVICMKPPEQEFERTTDRGFRLTLPLVSATVMAAPVLHPSIFAVEQGVRVHDEAATRDVDGDPGCADFHLPPVGEVQGLGDGERTRLDSRDHVRDLAFESGIDEAAEGHAIVGRRIAHGAERRDERHERQHCHRPGADRPPGTIREESTRPCPIGASHSFVLRGGRRRPRRTGFDVGNFAVVRSLCT